MKGVASGHVDGKGGPALRGQGSKILNIWGKMKEMTNTERNWTSTMYICDKGEDANHPVPQCLLVFFLDKDHRILSKYIFICYI